LKCGGHVAAELKQECHLEPWGQSTLQFEVKWPTQPGPCTLEAELTGVEGKPVRSLRDTQVVDASSFGLAFQKTATASSVHAVAYAAANAVDGDPATYWSSAFSDPAWLAVDLGAVHKIGQVRILWEAAFSKAFSVQVSTDGQGWTEVYHTAEGKGGTSEIRFAPVAARQMRVLGTERGTQWGHAIRELEVFE
ncbi:MAG TPA: discoidin domain-containing protein, partial [Candidatus Sulfotelmatobacter sp.]|nr:discoidin domain-containing protein [Candidatus Sulfotelmatobacter sp.]